MNLSESETKVNLMRAFAGECMARARYNLAASNAKSEGHYVISALFDYIAKQEQAHSTVFYNHLKELSGTNFDICAAYPIDVLDSTAKYLSAAVKNETEEYDSIYKSFGDTAKNEGFNSIANSFFSIAEIEKTHAQHFNEFLTALNGNKLYKSENGTIWICTNCGHIHIGTSAPESCPVCSHPQGYFVAESIAVFKNFN